MFKYPKNTMPKIPPRPLQWGEERNGSWAASSRQNDGFGGLSLWIVSRTPEGKFTLKKSDRDLLYLRKVSLEDFDTLEAAQACCQAADDGE